MSQLLTSISNCFKAHSSLQSHTRASLFAAFCLTIFILTPSWSSAAKIEEVVSTSPAWDTFTQKDGNGLYHEVLRAVFAQYNISVRHKYSKSSRSEELVVQNVADMMTCDDKTLPPLVMGRYPMYVNDYYVFFKKDRIGPWKGQESLRDKEILSQPTYYDQRNFSVPVRVKDIQTGAQALAMILMDRSDFYVDDLTLIKQSLKENSIKFDNIDFDTQKVGTRSYHPLFNTTERGLAIKKMYEDGIYKLHKAGKLKPIYEKWGYDYPDFDSF